MKGITLKINLLSRPIRNKDTRICESIYWENKYCVGIYKE